MLNIKLKVQTIKHGKKKGKNSKKMRKSIHKGIYFFYQNINIVKHTYTFNLQN